MQALAVDISLAGLLGENIYNFGELLLHPIVSLSYVTKGAFVHCLKRIVHMAVLRLQEGLWSESGFLLLLDVSQLS